MRRKTREDHHAAKRQLALRAIERVKGRWWHTTDVMPGVYGSADADDEEIYRYHASRRSPWYVGPLIFFGILFLILFMVIYLLGQV